MILAAISILPFLAPQAKPANAPQPVVWTSAKPKQWELKGFVEQAKPTALGKFANTYTTRKEKAQYDRFLRITQDDWVELEKQGFENMYSYESTTKVQAQTPALVSFTTACYSYMGGAHGIGITRTYNFGFLKGKPSQLTLMDFAGTKANRDKVLARLFNRIRKTKGTDWVEEGMVKGVNSTQAERFWIGKKGITWEFDPYELGSYASGPFTFLLTWKDLKGLVRFDTHLKGVAR